MRLAVSAGSLPYIIPLNYGYDGSHIYFHTAREGRKIAYLEGGGTVCFEMEQDVRLQPHDKAPCGWGMSGRSVIGYGQVSEVTGYTGKVEALSRIMAHYSDEAWEFTPEAVEAVRVWKLAAERVTGKEL